jgi:hypothetical protein
MALKTHLQKLLELAGPPLADGPSRFSAAPSMPRAAKDLQVLLAERNGFYAFEAALLVRPSGSSASESCIEEWNEPSLWIRAYDGLADSCLFFAEDAFGGQFCIGQEGVLSFDPETGERSVVAADLEGWASAILREYEVLTGFPLAHEWQQRNGPLPPRMRLVPKIPFVLGGAFDISNLHASDSVKAMNARGSIASQLRDLPDGATIELKVVD